MELRVTDYKNLEFIKKFSKMPITDKYSLFPATLKILKNIKNKKILDLGCGPGNLAVILAERGAIVDALDKSKEWKRIWKTKPVKKNLKWGVIDASNLKGIKNKKYDFVIMNTVYTSMGSKAKVKKSFKEVSRVLKPGGVYIFSDLNPIAIMAKKEFSGRKRYPSKFSYYKDGSKFITIERVKEEGEIEFIDVHWKLETYTCFLENAGMYVFRIIEPKPIKSSPKILKEKRYPSFIMFICKKLNH